MQYGHNSTGNHPSLRHRARLRASGKEWQTLPAAEHGIDSGPLRPSLLQRLETQSGMIETAPELLMQALATLVTPTKPDDTKALLLIGRRDIRSNNSWMHNSPRLVKGNPRHHLLMHAEDIQSRGLNEGGKVRIRSSVGEIFLEIKTSTEVMPGVVCLPHGFGHQRAGLKMQRAEKVLGASYNDLTSANQLDEPSGNAALNGVRVWVEAV